MTAEEQREIQAIVLPVLSVNSNIIWSSSDNSVAVVSETGIVTAKAAGTATITAATEDGSKTAMCLVTVTVKYSVMQWIIRILLFGWLWY